MEFHWSIFFGLGEIFVSALGRDKQLIWEYRNREKKDQRLDPATSADRPPLGGPRHRAVASATQDSRFERLNILKPPALPGDTYSKSSWRASAWHGKTARCGRLRGPSRNKSGGRRRPDPLAKVTEQLHAWFTAEPWRTGRELLARLQVEYPETYGEGLLHTFQRRLKIWRSQIAHTMVFGAMHSQQAENQAPAES